MLSVNATEKVNSKPHPNILRDSWALLNCFVKLFKACLDNRSLSSFLMMSLLQAAPSLMWCCLRQTLCLASRQDFIDCSIWLRALNAHNVSKYLLCVFGRKLIAFLHHRAIYIHQRLSSEHKCCCSVSVTTVWGVTLYLHMVTHAEVNSVCGRCWSHVTGCSEKRLSAARRRCEAGSQTRCI